MLGGIRKAGGQLVALTPELPDKSVATTEKLKLEFEVLTDRDIKVTDQFGLVFKMTTWIAKAMRDFATLKSHNGEGYDEETMPLSATYLIRPDRTIAWAFLDPEYRNRATPEQIIAALEKLPRTERKP